MAKIIDSHEDMLERAISWFEDIAEMCNKLTTGNVSHQGASINGIPNDILTPHFRSIINAKWCYCR